MMTDREFAESLGESLFLRQRFVTARAFHETALVIRRALRRSMTDAALRRFRKRGWIVEATGGGRTWPPRWRLTPRGLNAVREDGR